MTFLRQKKNPTIRRVTYPFFFHNMELERREFYEKNSNQLLCSSDVSVIYDL